MVSVMAEVSAVVAILAEESDVAPMMAGDSSITPVTTEGFSVVLAKIRRVTLKDHYR